MAKDFFVDNLETVKELSIDIYSFITDNTKCNANISNGRIDFSDGCYCELPQ